MKKLLLLFVALPFLMAFRPGGEPEFFQWTEPTERVDGTPITSAEISAYILRCSKNGTSGAFNQNVAVGGQTQWNVPVGTFTPGTWVCQLYARDLEARTSDPSGAVEFLVTTYIFLVEPKAPTGLSVG
jgi:hypothetical protein